jgi:hypothetical protein
MKHKNMKNKKLKKKLIKAVITQIIHDNTDDECQHVTHHTERLLDNIKIKHLIAYLPTECNYVDHGVYGQSDFTIADD